MKEEEEEGSERELKMRGEGNQMGKIRGRQGRGRKKETKSGGK